jgi:MFS family permease
MLLFVLALAFGITLVGFGLSGSYALSLVVLLGVGAGGTGYMTLNNTLIQSNVPQRMLGRVMSIYMMTFALMPMGVLPVGALGDAIGVGTAVAWGGAIVVFFVLAMAILPAISRWLYQRGLYGWLKWLRLDRLLKWPSLWHLE